MSNLHSSAAGSHSDEQIAMLQAKNAELELQLQQCRAQVQQIEAKRQQAEAALLDQQYWLRTVLDAVPDPIYMKDAEGRWFLVNQAGIDLFQFSEADYLGRTDVELAANHPFHGDALLACAATDAAAWEQQTLWTGEESIPQPDRSSKILDLKKVPLFYPDGRRKGLVAIGRDIAQRKQTELALQKSEQYFRSLFEQAAVGMGFTNYNGRFLQVNQTFCSIVGYSQEELQAMTFQDLTHPDDLEADLAYARQIMAGEIDQFSIEKRYIRKDGSIAWVRLTVAPVHLPTGEQVMTGVVEDISEKVRLEADRLAAESALRQSEEQLRQIADNISDVFFLRSIETGELLYTNPAHEQIYGQSIEALSRNPTAWTDHVHPDDRDRILAKVEQEQQGQEFFDEEYRIVCPDGSERWIWDRSFPIYNADGKIYRFAGIARDISDRKRLELALQNSETRLRDVLNSANASISSLRVFPNRDWEYAYVSSGCEVLSGYTAAELMADKRLWLSRVVLDETARDRGNASARLPFEDIFAERALRFEYQLRHKDGSLRWVAANITSRWDANDACWIVTAIDTDISERKQIETARQAAEATLWKTQHQLQAILDNSPAVIYLIDTQNRHLLVNRSYANLLSTTPEALIGKTNEEVWGAEIATAFAANNRLVLQSNQPLAIEEFAPHADSLHTYLTIKFPLRDRNDVPYAVCGISTDISDRKRAEAALHQSEEQRRLALDLTHTGSWDFDVATGEAIWSDSHYRLMGLVPGEAPSNYQAWRDRVHPKELASVEQAFNQALATRTPLEVEYRVIHPDGVVRWVLTKGQGIYDQSGQPVRMVGVMMDISDRKRAEKSLRQYERIVSVTPDWMSLVDRNYTYQLVNQTYLTWNQKSWDEIVGHPVSEVVGEAMFQSTVKPYLDRCLAGETVHYEAWFDFPRGDRCFVSVIYAPYREADGTISGAAVTSRDLTSLKQAEAALAESEAFLSSIYTNTQVSFFIVDVQPDGDFRFAGLNPAHERFTGISTEELRGKTPEEVLPADAAALIRQHYQDCVDAGKSITYDESILFIGGNPSWWITTLTPLWDRYGRIYRLVGSSLNVTERVEAEQYRERQRQKSQVLSDITLKICQSLQLDEILQTTVDEVQQLLQADRVLIYRFQPDWSGTVLTEAVSSLEYAILGQSFHDPCFGTGYVDRYQQGRISAIADVLQAEIQDCHKEFLSQVAVRANLVVPLLQDQILWGLLIVHQCSVPRHWTADETELLQQLANQVSIALAQSQLVAALQRSESKLRALFAGMTDVVLVFDAEGRYLKIPATNPGLLYRRADELVGKTLYQVLPADRAEQFFQAIQRVLNYQRTERIEYQLPIGDREVWFSASVSPLSDTSVLWVARDITELKQTEIVLRQQAKREQALNRVIRAVRASLDLDTVFATATVEMVQLLQIDRAVIAQYLPERACWLHIAQYRRDAATPDRLGLEVPDRGNPFATQLKRLEIVQVNDTDTISDAVNRELAKTSPGAWLLVPIVVNGSVWGCVSLDHHQHSFTWGDDRMELAQAVADQLAIAIQQANLLQQVQQLNRELEQRVEERTTQLNLALSASRMGTWEWDMTTNRERWSTSTYALFGWQTNATGAVLDPTGVEISPFPTHELLRSQIHPEDLVRFNHALQQALAQHSTYEAEFRITRTDGSVCWCYARGSYFYNEAGEPTKLAGVCIDVTERQQAEAKIRESLQEKEVLLKEIHHRVKNNLQIVSSLLRMQSRYAKNDQVATLFQEAQNRVQSMALIHEQLYQTADLSQIDFGEYLHTLVNNLFRTYGVSQQRITFHIETQALTLTLITAIPCGLIINELVSNALKYAFPDGRSGEISIQLHVMSPNSDAAEQAAVTNQGILLVRDNGIGMPETLDLQTVNSLGLRIVRNLVSQLKGTLTFDSNHGTCARIMFPL